jgi:hypothetical protein
MGTTVAEARVHEKRITSPTETALHAAFDRFLQLRKLLNCISTAQHGSHLQRVLFKATPVSQTQHGVAPEENVKFCPAVKVIRTEALQPL